MTQLNGYQCKYKLTTIEVFALFDTIVTLPVDINHVLKFTVVKHLREDLANYAKRGCFFLETKKTVIHCE